MSQVTQRSPTLTPDVLRRNGPGAGWFLEGALAAGLGLAGLAVCALVLWTVSPYPESSPGGALRTAADLWLLGHGSPLVRTGTPSGVPAPVALTPLLLAVPPAWLLYRAYVQALEEAFGDEVRRADEVRRTENGSGDGNEAGNGNGPEAGAGSGDDIGGSVLAPLVCVAGGYLATGAVAVLFAAAGSVQADVPGAALRLPLFTVCVALAATWPAWRSTREPAAPGSGATGSGATGFGATGSATPAADGAASDGSVPGAAAAGSVPAGDGALDSRWQEGGSWAAVRAFVRRAALLRTAVTGTAVLCGGGLLLVLTALLWHGEDVEAAFVRLAGETGTGQFGLLLLVVALLPNAAVWTAAYALGPGFALGTDTAATPLVPGLGDGGPALPPFPLLEALPDGIGLLACVVPLAAAAVVGRRIGRAAVPVPGRFDGTAGCAATVGAVVLVAAASAVAVAVLAAVSGGALGTRNLAVFGPDWWSTGKAAFSWCAVAGSPAALAVRAARLRTEHSDEHLDDWHTTGVRRARWASMKTASGGLMPDFTPRRD